MIITAYRVVQSGIAFEHFDDETIVINLLVGKYYSLRDTASSIWRAIEQQASVQQILNAMTQAYGDASMEELSKALSTFLKQLHDEGLINPTQQVSENAVLPVFTRQTFTPPVLEVYTDMQEIIMLDPVHDINAELGWPAKKE